MVVVVAGGVVCLAAGLVEATAVDVVVVVVVGAPVVEITGSVGTTVTITILCVGFPFSSPLVVLTVVVVAGFATLSWCPFFIYFC